MKVGITEPISKIDISLAGGVLSNEFADLMDLHDVTRAAESLAHELGLNRYFLHKDVETIKQLNEERNNAWLENLGWMMEKYIKEYPDEKIRREEIQYELRNFHHDLTYDKARDILYCDTEDRSKYGYYDTQTETLHVETLPKIYAKLLYADKRYKIQK